MNTTAIIAPQISFTIFSFIFFVLFESFSLPLTYRPNIEGERPVLVLDLSAVTRTIDRAVFSSPARAFEFVAANP
jgi:hypothetical protein